MRETTFRVSQKSATTTPTEPKGDTSQSEQPSGNGFPERSWEELEVRAWPSSRIRLQLQLQLPAKEKKYKEREGKGRCYGGRGQKPSKAVTNCAIGFGLIPGTRKVFARVSAATRHRVECGAATSIPATWMPRLQDACVRKRNKPKMVYDHCNLFGVGDGDGVGDGVRVCIGVGVGVLLKKMESETASHFTVWFLTRQTRHLPQDRYLHASGSALRGMPLHSTTLHYPPLHSGPVTRQGARGFE